MGIPPKAPADEEDFAALLAEYEGQPRRRDPEVGELVTGRVVSVGRDAVFVNIGAKSEAMIDTAELRDEEGRLAVKVGDSIEARVVEVGGKAGCTVLRRTMGRGAHASAEIEQAFALGVPVDGVVTGVNKGGVEVQVAGLRAFCPVSQLDIRRVEDASAFVGQRLTFRITRYEKGNLVLSRRALLEEAAQARAAATRARLAPGAVMRGTVTAVKEYGAFVDLGGLEGMIHKSELGFDRNVQPGEVLSAGQEVEVQVLRIEKQDDPRHPERIALSLKSLAKDPWDDVPARFQEGARVSGKVTRVEPYGAFVELAAGVEGLVHVSELAPGRRVHHAREVAQVGATLAVVVLGLDRDKRRLSLGVAPEGTDAEDMPPPEAPQKLGTFGDLLKRKR